MRLPELTTPRLAVLAAGSCAVLIAILVAFAGRSPDPFGVDFAAYRLAADRLAHGMDIYTAAQLAGPFDPQTANAFLYPPIVALALTPLLPLPFLIAAIGFAALNWAALVASVVIASSGSFRARRRTWLMAVVAVNVFPPAWYVVYNGQIGGLVVLATAIALRSTPTRAGLAVAAGALMKVTPGAMLLPLALRGWRGAAAAAAATASVIVVTWPSLGHDWLRFPIVLLNLGSGHSGELSNLAPHIALTAWWSAPAALVVILRLITLLAGAGLLVTAIVRARVGRHTDAMLAAALASIVIPGSVWIHYLALLLPLAAATWTGLTRARRRWLLAGMVAISTVAVASVPPLILAGILITAVTLLRSRAESASGAPLSDLARAA